VSIFSDTYEKGVVTMSGLKERWIRLRNRIVTHPSFQRRAARFPLSRPVARQHAARLFAVVTGFVYTQVTRAAVELDLFTLLSDGPLTPEILAEKRDLPLSSASAFLKAAASINLAESVGGERYLLGLNGAALSVNPGLAEMILHHDALYKDLADPVGLLRRGGGEGVLANYWPYGDQNEDSAGRYSSLMSVTQPMVAEQILTAYDFGRHKSLMDIGGGKGAFLKAVAVTNPTLSLTLFDLPEVVAGAQTSALCVGGSFIVDPIPPGHDCISLVRVLHDHDDSVVIDLLAKVRAALPAGGRLVVAEPMAETRGAEPMGHAYFGLYLLAMGSGRPRTAKEYHAFLRAAGFADSREYGTDQSLICRVIVATA
jgi:demethylspheroidene O-methyltransferase